MVVLVQMYDWIDGGWGLGMYHGGRDGSWCVILLKTGMMLMD
jgi:hypothetical protein